MSEATLWTGGRIFTGERYVESLLVENGRVVAAGPAAEVRRQAPTGAEHEPLDGRLAIPGLVDAHLHLVEIARVPLALDLSAARSLDELRSLVTRWAADHRDGPIVGRGWHEDRLRERRAPTLRDLDPAVPDRPVVLHHASGHAAVLNTAALTAGGLGNTAGAPASGTIGRFADGSPNGLLYEQTYRSVVGPLERAIPLPGAQLESTLRSLLAVGLTRVGTLSASAEEVAALRELDAAGRLPLTVRAYLRLAQLDEMPDSLLRARTGRFSIVGAKAFVDGAFGPRTAWLSEPYADDPTGSGLPVGDEEGLAEKIAAAAGRGLSPAVHAIGDRAIDRVARLLEPWTSKPGPPARMEHVALTPPRTLDRLDRVRPTLVVQPGFLWSDWWLSARLGRSRARWAYLFRTLIDRGHRVAGSSDAPYDPTDPWRGIRAAVARRDARGLSANPNPSEALGGEEALALYTSGAAGALGDRDEGRLEPGCSADLVVLRYARLSEAVGANDSPVRETWVGGRRVHRATPRETL
jgi:predicted amidohydrolase YtcJ